MGARYFHIGLAVASMSSVLLYSWYMWSKFSLFPITNATPSTNADVEWHPPNATSINNLTTTINGAGTYGFIFNSSVIPDGDYGVYNFCNMPHVRRKEYKRPDDGFELKYVEVVCYGLENFPSDLAMLLCLIPTRSIGITNGPPTKTTPSLLSPTPGPALTKASSTTANPNTVATLPAPTGRATNPSQTLSIPRASKTPPANSRRLRETGWRTHGGMGGIYGRCITTY
jgi:hypothetical protein